MHITDIETFAGGGRPEELALRQSSYRQRSWRHREGTLNGFIRTNEAGIRKLEH